MADFQSTPEAPAPAPDKAEPAPAVTPTQQVYTPSIPPASTANGLAIAALVVGIIALVTGWIPIWGLLIGVAAIVLGILGIKKSTGKGMAIAGLITGAIGALWALVVTGFFILALILSASATNTVQEAINLQNGDVKALVDAKKDFSKGETANFANTYEVKVNSVQTAFVPGEYYTATEGKEFLLVNITVKNISDKSEFVSPFSFSLIENGLATDASTAPAPDKLQGGQLESGASVTGSVVYEITPGASGLKLSYTTTVFDQSYQAKELKYTLAI